MGATPNFDTNTAHNSGRTQPIGTSPNPHPDDVSFNRTGTAQGGSMTDNMADTAKHAIDSGMHKAQDAVGQLQAKAGEITSRLVDNINVDDLTQKLEQQVREHPARTLLLAVGAGYLLGKSLHSK